MIEFKECTACATKPGAPYLCAACLHNRATINRLRELVEDAIAIALLEESPFRIAAAQRWIDKAQKEIG